MSTHDLWPVLHSWPWYVREMYPLEMIPAASPRVFENHDMHEILGIYDAYRKVGLDEMTHYIDSSFLKDYVSERQEGTLARITRSGMFSPYLKHVLMDDWYNTMLEPDQIEPPSMDHLREQYVKHFKGPHSFSQRPFSRKKPDVLDMIYKTGPEEGVIWRDKDDGRIQDIYHIIYPDR